MNTVKIDQADKYHISIIRNKKSTKPELLESLEWIGRIMGKDIFSRFMTEDAVVMTPMEETYKGVSMLEKSVLVISTASDKDSFAKGIISNFKNCYSGYIDYEGKRGKDALTQDFRQIQFPEIPYRYIDVLIVGKTVLATGCTAISLTRRAIEKYKPKAIVIASTFYSQRGYIELKNEFPHAEILVIEEDQLNNDGMLIPGIGDLDRRISA